MPSQTLIIGGNRGIGLAINEIMSGRGDTVFTASRSRGTGGNHFCVNLPGRIDVDQNFELNYLVFAHRYRGSDWSEDFDVTIKAVDLIVNQLKDSFSGDSSIVILGSNAGHFVLAEQTASYHTSRAALEGLARYYAVTLGRKGVRCNVVLPTTIIKQENSHFFTKDNETRKMIERVTPLGRMGTAEDVGNMVGFLCSERASFITGQTFFIDGGLSIVGQESIARDFSSLMHNHEK